MKEALSLIKKWEESKRFEPKDLSEGVGPILAQIVSALGAIANKKLPVPNVTIEQPDVKVELENPIEVNVPKQEQKAPIVNVNPKINIPEIIIPAHNSANEWDFEIYRDSRGLINNIKAKRVEE